MNKTPYELIEEFYASKTTVRSQVPLMNHINEGLAVLKHIGATQEARDAYCLHPLLQNDSDLFKHTHLVAGLNPYVVLLAMEYRSVANEYLSSKVGSGHIIRLSPLDEVNQMLVADKVQNRKDFIKYHLSSHARSSELNVYFREWLSVLNITEEKYTELCEVMKNATI